MSVDDQRNVAIVEIGVQTNLGSKLQGLRNMDLVLTAMGVDPVFRTPTHPLNPPPVVSGDTATFDAGPLTSGLPLGGSAHLVMRRNGDFTFSTHAHDSGFDNIEYEFRPFWSPRPELLSRSSIPAMWRARLRVSPLERRTGTTTPRPPGRTR